MDMMFGVVSVGTGLFGALVRPQEPADVCPVLEATYHGWPMHRVREGASAWGQARSTLQPRPSRPGSPLAHSPARHHLLPVPPLRMLLCTAVSVIKLLRAYVYWW